MTKPPPQSNAFNAPSWTRRSCAILLERFAVECDRLSAKEVRPNKDLEPRSAAIGTRKALANSKHRVTSSILLAILVYAAAIIPGAAQNRRSDGDIKEIERQLEKRRREEARLTNEATTKAKEVEELNKNLVETAAALQDAEKRISEIEIELANLEQEEQSLKQSLASEREVLGDILGALQSLERSRPPAMLLTPEDSAKAARTAILLSSAAPELKEKADALKRDLDRLKKVTDALAKERASYEKTNTDVSARRKLLADLLTKKKRERDVAQRLAATAQSETAALAARETDLRGVLEGLQKLARVIIPRIKPPKASVPPSEPKTTTPTPTTPSDKTTPPERAPSRAPKTLVQSKKSGTEQTSATSLARTITPRKRPIVKPKAFKTALPFGKARGQLQAPVVGDLVGQFGKKKPEGGSFDGIRYAAKNGAIVTAPYRANVVFARFYQPTGNLIVLDVGDKYHVLFMGVGSFLVEEGQTISAGEPIAVMVGDQPKLDVEIRRAREPVNPMKWLTQQNG